MNTDFKKIMFLHISNDDKFINIAIDHFEEVAPNRSIYLIDGVDKNSLKNITYLTKTLFVYPFMSEKYDNFLSFIKPNTIIILHGLSSKHKKLLPYLGKKHTIVWIAVGDDLYQSKKLRKLQYKEKTKNIRNLLLKKKSWERGVTSGLKYEISNIIPGLKKRNSIDRYLRYIDYISPVIKEDYDLFINCIPNKYRTIKYLPFNYGNVVNVFRNHTSFKNGRDILVGNSANYPNNHYETFKLLKNYNLDNRTIYVPLSYGGTKEYVEYIKNLGKSFFGKSFYPILSFLPIDVYNNFLEKIGFAFMNFTRQHGVGNILLLLYNGVKVYIDEKSTIFKHLQNLDLKIFSINKLDDKSIFTPLSDIEKKKNREKILLRYNDKILKDQTKDFINTFIYRSILNQ